MITSIYALKHPLDLGVRYIGKTDRPIHRLRCHLARASAGGTHKDNWVNNLKAQGLSPVMEILAEIKTEDWQDAERAFIVAFHLAGFDLTNTTDGGRGGLTMSPEIKAKIGDAHRGKVLSVEQKDKISRALRGKKLSIQHKKNISAGLVGRKISEETRNKIRYAHLGMKHSEAARRKISLSKMGNKYRKQK
jgi:hypothetical protein